MESNTSDHENSKNNTVISFKISKADAGLKKKTIQNHPLKLQYHKLDEEILKSQVVRFAINIKAPNVHSYHDTDDLKHGYHAHYNFNNTL